MKKGTTLTRFLIEEQRRFPQATGDFTALLAALTTAGKIIAQEVNKAGLGESLGLAGHANVHGEEVQKLDDYANDTIINAVEHTGYLAGMASEEMEGIYHIPDQFPTGKYILLFDPVDGSSNIDVNISIGTIFSIYEKKNGGRRAEPGDFLQLGHRQVGAGYIIYGSSTMLVYTTGHGVHGFTLDPNIGEFLLSNENITIPNEGTIYSVNESYYKRWCPKVQHYVGLLKDKGHTARYIGSLVADFHRNLLKGGVFLYPAEEGKPEGKLRLMYEAAPLAFIVAQAGGRASTGYQDILDVEPKDLHQRVPLIIGSTSDVELAESVLAQDYVRRAAG
ncbi:MAG: class 1 fructose-bisphosphatase [Candidatus Latescibacteria bacterium]|nr:class 1 fructose-bisphosphatase [Candidatus Latescibacterota bacterium]